MAIGDAPGDIYDEWQDYSATVTYTQYYPLSDADADAGLTATRVKSTTDVREPGANCPDGHEFDDGSVVLATSGDPKTTEDVEKMHKDDRKQPKELHGDEAQANKWHAQVREDIDGAPDDGTYKDRKVYVVPAWDLESQLEDIKKGRVTKRIKRGR